MGGPRGACRGAGVSQLPHPATVRRRDGGADPRADDRAPAPRPRRPSLRLRRLRPRARDHPDPAERRPAPRSPTPHVAIRSMVAEPFLEEHHAYLRAMLDLAAADDVDVVHNHSLHYLPIAMASTLACPAPDDAAHPADAVARERDGDPARAGRTPTLRVGLARPTPGLGACRTDRPRRPQRHPAREWPFATDRRRPRGLDGAAGPREGAAPRHRCGRARRRHRSLLAGPVGDRGLRRRARSCRGSGPRRGRSGHLDTAALAALVGSARACLVTPAWEEPYGLVVAEALACGTPVVGFARGALPELIDTVLRRPRPARRRRRPGRRHPPRGRHRPRRPAATRRSVRARSRP